MQKLNLLDLRTFACFLIIVLSVRVVAMSIQALERLKLPSLSKKPRCFAICALKINVNIWAIRDVAWVIVNP